MHAKDKVNVKVDVSDYRVPTLSLFAVLFGATAAVAAAADKRQLCDFH